MFEQIPEYIWICPYMCFLTIKKFHRFSFEKFVGSWINLFITFKYLERNQGGRDIENRPMDMEGGEQGEGGMYGESNMEIYNTICKIDSQWKFAV